MKKRALYSICLLLSGSLTAWGQSDPIAIFHNDLRVFLGENGATKAPAGSPEMWLSVEQENEWIPLIFQSGLWLGGLDDESTLLVTDLTEGGQPGTLEAPEGFDRIWQVTAEEIEQHLADLADNGLVDEPLEAIYGWPAVGNPHFLDYSGFELPDSPLAGLAPFWDQNADGLYDPDDGDFPILSVRGCDIPIIPTQMSWCIFTMFMDQEQVRPIECQLILFTFACEEAHPLNNTIFLHYRLVHRVEPGGSALFDTRLGWYLDPDLGCLLDDYVGSFPDRFAGFAYNRSNEDVGCDCLPGLGTNPPAIGFDLLRGPLTIENNELVDVDISHIMPFYSPIFGSFPSGTTDPSNLSEYYNYLQGFWRDGTPLTVGGIGYGGSQTTQFAFPGFPAQPGAWTEWEANNPDGDRRLLMAYEPFELQAGAVNEVIAAITLYRDGADHLDQVVGLRDQLDQVQAYYDLCFQVENAGDLPPCTQVLTDVGEPAPAAHWSFFPNPAFQTLQIDIPDQKRGDLALYDLTGRLCASWAEIEDETAIQLGALPPGLYVLTLTDSQGRQSSRKLLVVQ